MQLDSTVRNLQETTRNLAEFTDSLGATSHSLNLVIQKINQGDGSLGKLLNDPGLYADLRRLTTRLDSLTLGFKQHPKRYINLRIF